LQQAAAVKMLVSYSKVTDYNLAFSLKLGKIADNQAFAEHDINMPYMQM
jgi:hypothetical protein